MSPAQTLELILDAQQAVRDADRVVLMNERHIGKGLITWRTVVDSINERERLEGVLTATLEGALAHREEWCHDSTDCPVCIRDREEIAHVIDNV